MCIKGYVNKVIKGEKEIIYFCTLKGLRQVFRKNISVKYFEAFNGSYEIISPLFRGGFFYWIQILFVIPQLRHTRISL